MRSLRGCLLLGTLLGAGLLAHAADAPSPPAAALRAEGLDHFYNLEYDPAIADFTLLIRQRPDDAAAWNHLAQARLYCEMYRIGALESELYGHGDPFLDQKLLPPNPGAVRMFTAENQRARDLATAAVARNPADANAHYDLAVALGLRGTLEFSLQQSYLAALSDAKAARREAARAAALDPGFVDPHLILGVHSYVAGSLPWSAKLFATLDGYRGSKERGRSEIAAVAAGGEHARTDAAVLLAVIDRRDGLNRRAAQVLDQLSRQYPRNVLFAVEWAEALEAAGEHEPARAQYRAVLERASAGAPGYAAAPLAKVWYDLGNIERIYSSWRLAAADFERAEAAPHPQPRYVQAAAFAAGQAEWQAGAHAAARAQFQRCLALDPTSPAGKAAAHALRVNP